MLQQRPGRSAPPATSPRHAGRAARIGGAGLAALLLVAMLPRGAAAQARDPRVQAMIDRATASIRGAIPGEQSGVRSIGAYALVAAGAPATDPLVSQVTGQILSRIGTAGYANGAHHFYEAGVDAMLLEAAGGATHKTALAAIAEYIRNGQEPTGCWNYPHERGKLGDTSVTQYALLGLWAAKRAGVEIPKDVWEKAANWHVTVQLPNGAFMYQPSHPEMGHGMRSHAMTAAGTANLLLCRHLLFPDAPPVLRDVDVPAAKRPDAPTARFGVLQEVDLDKVPAPAGGTDAPPVPATDRIDAAIRRGHGWLVAHYTMSAPVTDFPLYYLYVVERLCALADIKRLGTFDWYADGAQTLAVRQDGSGSWPGPHIGTSAHTAFGVLFLARVTGKVLGRRPDPVAGGILIGARGLPDDLKNVKIVDGKAEQPKLKGPIADLLTKLENLDDVPVESAQEAIVEQVLVGDREALVGQKDRLRKLATARDAEIRRTAVWALARCDDLRLAPVMIRALDDSDVDVLVEARNALCYLSRQPRGDGQKDTPLADVAEDASDEQKSQAVAKWRSAVRTHWRTWYFRVRPYDERDDLDEAETLRAANTKK